MGINEKYHVTLIANVHGVLAPKAGNVQGNVSTFSVGKYFLYWNNHKHKQDLALLDFYRYITFLNVLNIFNKKNTTRKRHIIQYMTMTCVVVVLDQSVQYIWPAETSVIIPWEKKVQKLDWEGCYHTFFSEKQTVCAVL